MRACSLVLMLLVAIASAAPTYAATRAEFDQLVQQIQAKPTDTKLREQVIAMAADLKPTPAIPETARQKFVAASAIAKSAKDASGQKLAIKRYQEALKIAPWWGDAYYNLALAQELASQFEGAIASLKLYILTKPSDKDAREAQDRIYALEGKADLAKQEAQATGTAPHKPQAAVQAAAPPPPATPSFDGARFVNRMYDGGGTLLTEYIIEVHGNQISAIDRAIAGSADAGSTFTMACVLNGLSCNLCCGVPGTLGGDPSSRHSLAIAADGRTATYKFYLPNGNLAETRVYQRQ